HFLRRRTDAAGLMPGERRAAGREASDPGGSRTRDLRIKSPLLYQLSYRVECLHLREVGACVRSPCRGQRPQSKRFSMPLRDRPRLGRPSVLIARPAASITALAARLTMRPRDALAACPSG